MNNTVIQIALPLIISYIIGAIPFSFLIAKSFGKNIMEEGSKNPGASNVLRVCGKKAGILAYILDIGKGIIAVVVSSFIVPPNSTWLLIASGVLAILGHVFSIFLKFKGGKGVATSCGVMFVLTPIPTVIAMVFFFIGLFASKKIVSVGTTTAVIVLPLVLTISNFFAPFLLIPFFSIEYRFIFPVTIVLALFIIIKHIPNYKRLLRGEENSFSKK